MLPETGPLPVISHDGMCARCRGEPLRAVFDRVQADMKRAENTPGPWRHLPRPTVLPPCPTWCNRDHSDTFGPDAIPVDSAADGGPIWDLAHGREVVVGGATVLIWQSVEILVDGTIVGSTSPDISWDGGEGDTPEAAADLVSALLAARLLLTRDAAG
jgi:hypothetical protein